MRAFPLKAAVLLALAAVAVAALAAPATGTRVVKINSKVTIQSRSLVFHGKVRSANRAAGMAAR